MSFWDKVGQILSCQHRFWSWRCAVLVRLLEAYAHMQYKQHISGPCCKCHWVCRYVFWVWESGFHDGCEFCWHKVWYWCSRPRPSSQACAATFQGSVRSNLTRRETVAKCWSNIITGNSSPVAKPGYRLSFKQKADAETMVKQLPHQGWIRPSSSPDSAPVLIVMQMGGSMRMCIDYMGLNSVTVKDRFPLPRIDDLSDKLKDARYFSSVDLQQGFHQIKIAEEDDPKTAFITHQGCTSTLYYHLAWRMRPHALGGRWVRPSPGCLLFLATLMTFWSLEKWRRAPKPSWESTVLQSNQLCAKLSERFF